MTPSTPTPSSRTPRRTGDSGAAQQRPVILLAPLLVLLASAAIGCPDSAPLPADGPAAVAPQRVVYGNDDRTDYFAHPDAELRRLARQSTAAIVPVSRVRVEDDTATLLGSPLGRAQRLCSDQRFLDHISSAECSATLIDDDLVLTAGHCMTRERDCDAIRIVFNHRLEAPGRPAAIHTDDVFSCQAIAIQRLTLSGDNLDFAILQLDRPATPRFVPAPVQATPEAIALGEPVAMIGFPNGIPVKLDSGGRVTRNRPERLDFFEATVDAFGGNSGSGVYDGDYRLIGLLARGRLDYVERSGARCWEVSRLPASDTDAAEGISYASRAIVALCDAGWDSPRLCGPASCGDGVCGRDETATSCPEDCVFADVPPEGWTCEAERYGDDNTCDCNCGVWDPACTDLDRPVSGCDASEHCQPDATCGPPPAVPPGWTCPPEAWNAGDGICDCACGAPDPDCVLGATVLHCPDGFTCAPDGVCVGPAVVVPDTWTCEPDRYGDGATCDCNCGAPDPDCADPALPVVGCPEDVGCGADGTCLLPDGGEDPSVSDDGCGCHAAPPVLPTIGWLLVLFGLRLRGRAAGR